MQFKVAFVVIVSALALSGCSGVKTPGLLSLQSTEPQVADAEIKSAIAVAMSQSAGRNLSASDHQAMAEAQSKAVRLPGVGGAVNWSNSETGHSGDVRPGPVYHVNGTQCRDVRHSIVFPVRSFSLRSTACQQGANVWQTLS